MVALVGLRKASGYSNEDRVLPTPFRPHLNHPTALEGHLYLNRYPHLRIADILKSLKGLNTSLKFFGTSELKIRSAVIRRSWR